MKSKLLNENIDRLNISCNSIEILKSNKILTLQDICRKNKTHLKEIGLENDEISNIEIELQLLGLDLKNNY